MVLQNPGDTFSLDANGNLIAVPGGSSGQELASSGPVNTVETLLVKAALIAGVTLRAGSKITFTLAGTCTSTNADVPTVKLRAGILGTVADAVVATIALSASDGAGNNIPFKITGELTIDTVGANGTFAGVLTLTNSGSTGIATSPSEIVDFSSATMPTTTATFFDVCFVTAAVTTTCTFSYATSTVTH